MPPFGGVPEPELTAAGTTAELDDGAVDAEIGATEAEVGDVDDDGDGATDDDDGAGDEVGVTTAANFSGAEVPVGALGDVPAAPLITQSTFVQSVEPKEEATLNDSVNPPPLSAVTGLKLAISHPLAPCAFAAHSTRFTDAFAA